MNWIKLLTVFEVSAILATAVALSIHFFNRPEPPVCTRAQLEYLSAIGATEAVDACWGLPRYPTFGPPDAPRGVYAAAVTESVEATTWTVSYAHDIEVSDCSGTICICGWCVHVKDLPGAWREEGP